MAVFLPAHNIWLNSIEEKIQIIRDLKKLYFFDFILIIKDNKDN